MKSSRLAAAAFAACLLAAPAASANGRIPASSYIAFSPSDPSFVVARVTFGMLVSRDAGQSWDWVCEQSIGYNGPEDPAIAIFQSNTVVATLASGLVQSPDRGCNFAFAPAPIPQKFFIDVAVRKTDAQVGYALLSAYAGAEDDAGALLFTTQVYRSGDNGGSWAKVGADLDPKILGETIDVAESDPSRLYLSSIRGSGDAVVASLYVSTDAGLAWTERAIPLERGERAAFIAAVDPKVADVLYVRTTASADQGARLLVSRDAGKTWETKFRSQGALLGFALSADGSKVWIGGPKDGLHAASTADFAFAQRHKAQIQCLAVAGDGKLWACSNEASGFTLGLSPDEGASFTSKMHLHEVRGPLACPSGATADKCVPLWGDQKKALGIEPPGDAGANADGGARPPGGGGGGGGGDDCNCSTPGSGGLSAGVAVCAVFVALGLARRKRAR
ncbi:MAG: hypothetical protein JNL38_27815 [Myxococcales bacterium]|jgi:photosystem II stability/assembly factor-like uncharacterized protein|nr:hypothetical protein [Myxococcales bacterium]